MLCGNAEPLNQYTVNAKIQNLAFMIMNEQGDIWEGDMAFQLKVSWSDEEFYSDPSMAKKSNKKRKRHTLQNGSSLPDIQVS